MDVQPNARMDRGDGALEAVDVGPRQEAKTKAKEAKAAAARAPNGPPARGRRSLLEPLKLALAVGAALLRTVALVGMAALRLLCPPRLKSLSEQIVLVTGAGHGLGRELALQFADCGCVVICVDLDESSNEVTARAINLRHAPRAPVPAARAYTCDVSDPAQVQRLAAAVLDDVGHVDVLVNNAGIMPVQPMLRIKPQQVVDVVNVNLLSHFWTLLAFLPHMVSRDSGHVVAISSMAGLTGLANKVPYSASKFAVAGLMDSLSEEMRLNAHNVKVTCVHPYFIHTRPDLPEDLHLRIPELTAEFAAAEVLRAVRQEAASVTIPRNLLFWINVLRALPQDARIVWRDLFYARVVPTDTATPQLPEVTAVGGGRAAVAAAAAAVTASAAVPAAGAPTTVVLKT